MLWRSDRGRSMITERVTLGFPDMQTAGKHFGGVDNLLELTSAQKNAFFGSNENQTWNVVAQNSFEVVG